MENSLCGDVKNVGFLGGHTSVRNAALLGREVLSYDAGSCYDEDFPSSGDEGF